MLFCRPWGKRREKAPDIETGKPAKAPSEPTALHTPNVGPEEETPGEHHIDMNKTKVIHGQLDEVTGIMNQSIDQARQRGEQVDDLQNKADELALSANQFAQNTEKVKRNLWYKDLKTTITLTIVALIVVVIIVGVVALQMKSGGGN